MSNFKEALNQHLIFKKVAIAAQNIRQPVYVVGGFVRDVYLNRPNKDIDFVTVGSGIALAEATAALLSPEPKVNIFKRFGTAQFPLIDCDIEFVGARKESYNENSRKPVVEDGSLEDDQLRRDFTINAMAISLNLADFGELSDPFGGIKDLEMKLIRTPMDPEVTFSDDPLRMMRAIRFASQLGFDIDGTTFEGLVKMHDRISIISQERITEELNKIIQSPKPSYGFKLLQQTGLLQHIFPELVALMGVETQDGKGHKDNFYHTLQVLDNTAQRSGDLWLRWAAILHDIAKPATKRFVKNIGWTFHGHEDLGARWVRDIFRKMRLPLDEKMRKVEKLVRLHLRPIALAKEGVSDSALRRLLVDAGDDLEELMILCRADITSKDMSRVKRYLGNFDRVEELLIEVEEKDKLRTFQPVMSGEMIMYVFDINPGKEVGVLKSRVREAILDCEVENELESVYEYLISLGEELGFRPLKTLEELSMFSNF